MNLYISIQFEYVKLSGQRTKELCTTIATLTIHLFFYKKKKETIHLFSDFFFLLLRKDGER